MNGYGRYKMRNGRTYEGQWKSDNRHGKGTFKWEDGRIYDGKDDKVNTIMIINMGKELLIGQMEGNIKGVGRMESSMDKGYIGIKKGTNMKRYGEKER
jgi:hypothetical protein